jgi:hypothetical protein
MLNSSIIGVVPPSQRDGATQQSSEHHDRGLLLHQRGGAALSLPHEYQQGQEEDPHRQGRLRLGLRRRGGRGAGATSAAAAGPHPAQSGC